MTRKLALVAALETLAVRIRARAIRRCGELLAAIDDGQGARTDKLGGGASPKLSRAQAARDAGLSRDQKREALRLARVPAAEFEAALNGERPPTAAALATRGKRPAPEVDLKGRDPADFRLATTALGRIAELVRFAAASDPAEAPGVTRPGWTL